MLASVSRLPLSEIVSPRPYEMLEPDAGKLAVPARRGRGGGNVALLPGRTTATWDDSRMGGIQRSVCADVVREIKRLTEVSDE